MPAVTTFAKLAAPAALASALLGAVAPAHATPSQGVTAETLTQFEIPGSWLPGPPAGHPAVPEQVSTTLRRIVIAPGGSTGWHHHRGHVQGLVAEGTLTRVFADCSQQASPAGSWVTEEPTGDHVGRNLGTTPVVLLVTYALPDGEPFSQDAPAHCP